METKETKKPKVDREALEASKATKSEIIKNDKIVTKDGKDKNTGRP